MVTVINDADGDGDDGTDGDGNGDDGTDLPGVFVQAKQAGTPSIHSSMSSQLVGSK